MRILALVASLALPCAAVAQDVSAAQQGLHITVSPNPATESDVITVSIEAIATQCTSLPSYNPSQNLGGGVISFDLNGTDACDFPPLHVRNYPVGPLDEGFYTFQFRYCGINTPGGEICTPSFANLTVVVRAARDARVTVLSVSHGGAVALVLLSVLAGLRAFRRR